jgi:CRP-like cAMP-binding protein
MITCHIENFYGIAFTPSRVSKVTDEDLFTMVPLHTPTQNYLLAALPQAEFARLSPHLELVPLLLGEVLSESGGKPSYVYFPTSAILSLHCQLQNGHSSEIAGVGNEGMLGVSLFMGGVTTPSCAMVQTGGYGYRMAARTLLTEFNRSGAVMRLLLRYTQALLTHMAQTAVCNRHHTVEQQLCRWLLLTVDRLDTCELRMTQELISTMLGVRREGITEAAGKLQELGLIRTRRGRITVIDRSGLESQACECYDVVRQEFARLLPDQVDHPAACPCCTPRPANRTRSINAM